MQPPSPASPQDAAARPFFARVESLRGLGAMLVAGYHISGWGLYGLGFLPHTPWPDAGPVQNRVGEALLWLLPGHAALMMFFVISGCVLHVSLQFGPRAFWPAAGRFVLARAFRIFPIVIVGTLFLLWAADGQRMPSGLDLSRPPGVGEILANMALLSASINPTLWAIQVEALMVPVILLLFFAERRWGTRVLVAAAVTTSLLSFNGDWALWKPLSNNLFAFVLGMLVPTLVKDWMLGLSRRAAQRALVLSVVVLFAAGPVFGFYSHNAAFLEAHAATVLVALAAWRFDLRGLGFLLHPVVRQIGLASGSYYVLHIPLLWLCLAAVAPHVPRDLALAAPLAVGVVLLPLMAVAIVPAAMLSFRLVEAPGMALGRRMLKGVAGAKDLSQPVAERAS